MEEKKVYKIGLLPMLLLILDIILIIVVIVMGIIIKDLKDENAKISNNNSEQVSSVENNENKNNEDNKTENTVENKVTNTTNTDVTNIVKNNNETNDNASSDVVFMGKVVENKPYIYDAQYTSNGVKVNSYSANDGNTYSVSDIVVPYINMESEDAKTMNSEIEKLYNKYVEEFKICSQNQNSFIKVKYETYITSNINSILMTVERGEENSESTEYISYNFDTLSGMKLDYNQVCYIAGINDATQDVWNCIDNLSDFKEYYIYVGRDHKQDSVDERNLEIESNKNQIYTSYQQDLLNNKLVYFLDNNLKLNISLKVVLPDDAEGYVKIVTV